MFYHYFYILGCLVLFQAICFLKWRSVGSVSLWCVLRFTSKNLKFSGEYIILVIVDYQSVCSKINVEELPA